MYSTGNNTTGQKENITDCFEKLLCILTSRQGRENATTWQLMLRHSQSTSEGLNQSKAKDFDLTGLRMLLSICYWIGGSRFQLQIQER